MHPSSLLFRRECSVIKISTKIPKHNIAISSAEKLLNNKYVVCATSIPMIAKSVNNPINMSDFFANRLALFELSWL